MLVSGVLLFHKTLACFLFLLSANLYLGSDVLQGATKREGNQAYGLLVSVLEGLFVQGGTLAFTEKSGQPTIGTELLER